jgi:hypothetical protein
MFWAVGMELACCHETYIERVLVKMFSTLMLQWRCYLAVYFMNTLHIRGAVTKFKPFGIYIYKNECLYVCLSRMRSYTIHPIAMKLR